MTIKARLGRIFGCGLAVILIAGLAGCLERKEEIRVRPDGSVTIVARFEGTDEELAGPFALPQTKQGWHVTREKKHQPTFDAEAATKDAAPDKNADDVSNDEAASQASDSSEQIVEAAAEFAAGAKLPSTFGDDSDVYLTFPTKIWRETREDGVYIHFYRRYERRDFAFVNMYEKIFVENKLNELEEKGKGFEDLERSEKAEMLENFAKYEILKQVELLQAAAESNRIETPQTAWLRSCNALKSVFDDFNKNHVDELLDETEQKRLRKRLAALGESLPKQALEKFFDELARLGSQDLADRLKVAYARKALAFRITESLRSHYFQVTLDLPGEIVAHDLLANVEDGQIVWDFNGEFLCDRSVELMATARIPLVSYDQ